MEHKYTKNQIDQIFQQAIGKKLGEIDTEGDFNRAIENPKITGIAGDVVEHSILGYPSDTKQKADILIDNKEVEVKTTGVRGEYLKPKTYVAKERLTITNVSPTKIKNEAFSTSALWNKLENTLLAYYLYDSPKAVPAKKYADFPFLGYQLHQFSDFDKKIIEKDWETVRDFCAQLTEIFKDNSPEAEKQAKEYSSAKKDLMYLETAPGWKNGPRFALKKSYVNTIINEHFEKQSTNKNNETLIKNSSEIENNSLIEIVENKFKTYINISQEKILKNLNIVSNAKNKNNIIARKILGLSSKNNLDNIDEFKKASIIPKTIQFDNSGKNKESMSLPTFNFKDLSSQHWDSSNINNEADLKKYLEESIFLFIVFQKNKNNVNILKGIKFFKFNETEINGTIKEVWQNTKNIINQGVNLCYDEKNNKVKNNFIKSASNMIIHIRPHSIKRSYIDNKYSNELPTRANWTNKPKKFSDKFMTTQSFWINNNYIKEIVSDLID